MYAGESFVWDLGELEYDSLDDSTPEIVLGAVVGCAAVLLICATLIGYLVYRRKAKVGRLNF